MGFQAFVMSVLLLVGCSAQNEPPAEPPASVTDDVTVADVAEGDAQVIVMLGDSLTAGFGLPDAAALPSVVDRKLTEAGYEIEVINAGVSGDTTSMGRARYNWSVASTDPDIVVIALGANDFLSSLPSSLAQDNLSALIEQSQQDGIEVILAGLSPRSEGADDSLEAEYAAIYPELATAYDVPLYPDLMAGVWNTPSLLLGDGLHPTAEGVEVMATGLLPVIISVIEAD
ncbi:arylesterase [Ponticaulis sp.]|uniref:arylesterase n=1 Tax=Ponticaulis sp. TaxID=2020902 RepID=UPI0025CFE6FC|nr:arylesterase [Ponticaulis sp.]